MLFVMDPIEAEDVAGSTSLVFMLEAQARGHEVLFCEPCDLEVIDGRAAARVTPVTLRKQPGDHVSRGLVRHVLLDDEVDVAFQRKDPPVDAVYVISTQILGTCRRTLVLNDPRHILAFNEKLFALHFPDLMAETTVTRDGAVLRDFMSRLGGEMIVKPLDGKGGEGIFHVHTDDRNLNSILEQATGFGRRWAMAQRYLPAVRQGDKRILLLEGEPIGAVLRVPAEKEVRANLHVGGRAVKTTLDDDDRRIVERVGPVLRDHGLFFVGIDVIGGKLTEINVTSPTGVQEVNALDGVKLESVFMDAVEKRLG
jgi:glutathione synthase